MRFDAPISYNGWTATLTRSAGGRPASGYIVDRLRPSAVQVNGYIDKRALRDGVDAGDVYLGARSFSTIVTTFGSTPGDFWDKAQDLLAAFSPTLAYAADTAELGFLPFDFYQPTADISTWPTSSYPYGIPMRYYLRPLDPPEYDLERDATGGTGANGMSLPFTIQLLARDPRKYLQTDQEIAITTATQTVTYRGDYPTFPIVTWTMTAAGASDYTIVIDGYSVVIDLSGQTSGNFELDYANRTFTKSGFGSVASLITSATYTEVAVGTTYRRINPTGMSAGTNLLHYREAFS